MKPPEPIKKHPLDMTNILHGHARIPIAKRIARLESMLDGDEAMADVTGWLIERRVQGRPPSWFAIGFCEPWTTTSLAALRFARFVDARDYIAEHMEGDSSVEPTEHVWLTDKKTPLDNRGERDFAALLDALGEWPKLPSPYILAQLGCALHPADHPDDWEHGCIRERHRHMNPALPALIKRLEKTTKQDHELDRLLEYALTIKGDVAEALAKFDRSTGVWCRPSLTGNLNAAAKMCERVLPGFRWEVGATLSPGYGAHIERRTNGPGVHGYIESGPTPELALMLCLCRAVEGEHSHVLENTDAE